ncbi:MAG: hypothetical protein DMF63_17565 [Acidobacteria bacterium]|nr:MAG: hypothetical protein DMF63_17565 [Acidobacteriota bacterium]
MEKAERLRDARNLLLKLHKNLVDHERAIWEGINGPATSGEFLNLLIEDKDFSWLRKFSTLIVDIDEMFAQKDGYPADAVELHLDKLRQLISMDDEDEDFKAKYQAALQQDLDAAARQGDLRSILTRED